ncbi:MAG TPA: acyl-CoA dehydrogenase family protein [Sporichthyaceae bacterium]|jgi:butyryl-CoA dehydrogenase|nr:acyl-CoA dehydrogenase family protein [Sporichthyaceae bacterium]
MADDVDPELRLRQLRSRCRTFAADVLRGVDAAACALPTPEERFAATRPAYEHLIREGFLRAALPVAVGGDNHGWTETAVLAEELYCGSTNVAMTLFGTVLGLQPIVAAGTDDQRTRLLAPFLAGTGAPLAAFCSSEPGGSANPAAPPPGDGVRTRAERTAGGWVIDGRKKWVSCATGWDSTGADVLTVLCRTEVDAPPAASMSIIAVERPVPGLALDRVISSVGFRAHLLPEFSLNQVSAPQDNLIGAAGAGLPIAGAAFVGASALVGMMAVALLRTAFDHAWRFAATESRGGVGPILDHQAVGYGLVDAKTSIEAVRALSLRACWALDTGRPAAGELAAHAKVFGSETAVRVITDLMRLVGVDSYDTRDPLGNLLQDALALPLFGGGNVGVRRRGLHAVLQRPDWDPRSTAE